MESGARQGGHKKLSLVIPVYFNEENIEITWKALRETLAGLPAHVEWEVIFVDDGSGDASYERLLDVHAQDPARVRVIKLTRNFGQVPAILAGMRHASGDACIVMSADLQDPPQLILEMVAGWQQGAHKIVLANRQDREDGFIARLTSRTFYRLMRRYAIPNMPEGGFDFFLIDRVVVDLINSQDEKNAFIQGQVLWTGYAPQLIPYTRRRRELGRSRWTLSRKIKYFVDGFVSYTETPIRLITVVGLVVSALSFAYALLIVLLWLLMELPVEGWAPIMVTMLGLGGIQLVTLGVIGEYLWRNAHETRRRPTFIVEAITGGDAPAVRDAAREALQSRP